MNFYRPLTCDLPFERRIRRAAAVRAAPRRRNNRFCQTYIEIYMSFSKFNFREFHLFCQPISYSNFKLCCLVKGKCYGTQRPEKGHTAMYVNVVVWLHTDCIFTHWLHFYTLTAFLHIDCIFTLSHNHTNLFTVFLLYVIIPGFCCPHVTNLNLVLLL